MPFSDVLKEKVRKRAAFRCCRCQEIGIDVHHITPESQGGSNQEENAAPLCQNCHRNFGDNPIKRKEIIQMRDWWYEQVGRMYSPMDWEMLGRMNGMLQKIDEKIDSISEAQGKNQVIDELKNQLKQFVEKEIDRITLETAQVVSSTLVRATDQIRGYWMPIIPEEQRMEGWKMLGVRVGDSLIKVSEESE